MHYLLKRNFPRRQLFYLYFWAYRFAEMQILYHMCTCSNKWMRQIRFTIIKHSQIHYRSEILTSDSLQSSAFSCLCWMLFWKFSQKHGQRVIGNIQLDMTAPVLFAHLRLPSTEKSQHTPISFKVHPTMAQHVWVIKHIHFPSAGAPQQSAINSYTITPEGQIDSV